MFDRRSVLLALGSLPVLCLFVSCRKQDDATPRLMQQLAILGDEIRTANREIKLLRQEVSELRQRAGLSSPAAPNIPAESAAVCVGESRPCRVPNAAAAADPKPGLPPRRDGPLETLSKPPSSNSGGPGGPS